MNSTLEAYSEDHRYLLEAVQRQAGLENPVALCLDEFYTPVLKLSRRGPVLPVDGVLVRDWNPDGRRYHAGLQLGMRLYTVEGIRFVRVRFTFNDRLNWGGLDFVAVGRADYSRFYKIAQRCRRDFEPPSPAPVLSPEQREVLWQNTIGYLQRDNLRRIRSLGGRAKRGILLMGPPGNGKTMACRWIWEECRRRRWEWRLVTPDTYRQARASDSIRHLFGVERRGIIFFDDMDLALRDRERTVETEDQAVFLGALDGIEVHEGVVFVFTSNCAPELIDRAFKRPGRLDVVLHFRPPAADMRRQLLERWHPEIRAALDPETVLETTDGFSFAEIEELKNLLIMHFMEHERWDWDWALDQFSANRSGLALRRRRVGFGPSPSSQAAGTSGG